MAAAPVEPDSFWGDWRTLRFLGRAAIRKAQAIGRWQQLAAWAVLLGLPVGLALLRRRFPIGWHPDPGRLAACGYACATASIVGVLASGARAPIEALGLSTLLSSPLRPAALMAKRTSELALLGAILLCLVVLPFCLAGDGLLALVARLPSLLVALTCGACQLACLLTIVGMVRHAVRAWLRWSVFAGALALALCWAGAFGFGQMLGVSVPPLEAAALVATGALGHATAARGLGWMHVGALAQAAGAVCLLACVLPRVHPETILGAAEHARRARERTRRGGTGPWRRAVGWPRPFGHGEGVLAWKSLAMLLNLGPWPLVPVLLGGVAAVGAGSPWVVVTVLGAPAKMAETIGCVWLGFVGEVAIIPAVQGALALGGDSLHPTWLLRYPVRRGALLWTALGIPCAVWTGAGAALALPWALVHPPAFATLVAATGTLALTVAATRLVGATFHLAWPPWTAPAGSRGLPTPLRLVVMFPWLAACGTGLATIAAGAPPLLAVTLAAIPPAVLIGCTWPLATRLLHRLELAPPPLARADA